MLAYPRMLASEVAIHLYNRIPHKTLKFTTPQQKLTPDAKSYVDKLRRFGCLAYAKMPLPDSKFSDRAIRTILVGYSKIGYVLWHPESQKYIVLKHVTFNEKLVYKDI